LKDVDGEDNLQKGRNEDVKDLLTCAKNASYQYGHSGFIRAMRSGAIALAPEEISTVHMTGMRFTKMPVERLVKAPAMRDGRIRSDAPSAEFSWTS
jgi:hypothetical protein